MSICPYCHTDLGDIQLNSGRCPTCGNILAWNEEVSPVSHMPQITSPPPSDRPKLASWSPPSTNDPVALLKATLARIVTRDIDPDRPQKPMRPLMPPSSAETPSAPTGIDASGQPSGGAVREARRTRGNDSGTVDFSVTPPNLPPLPGSPTADQNAPAATTKKSKPDSYAPTITPESFAPVSPDSASDSAGPSGKKPSTFDDRGFAATYDSGTIDPEDTERVAQLWKGTYADSTTPRTSLKKDSGVRAKDSRLVIKKRALKESKGTVRTGADYELINLIGEGGMGVVYAARQASIDRTVAVKMLKPEMASHPEQREKFLSEAVVTGDLDHPNIVPIYDLGSSEAGALFYSMKRVQGTPWMNVLADKSLPENVEILMKVADAVAFAHNRGVIHRDLKPENVMLGDFGEVLVMDWGLAMSTASFRKAESITQSSSMGGTPAYMAPEMATGPVDRISPISDVYLLGAILFEILTGKPPHTGKNVMNCLFAAAKNEIQPCEQSGELLEIGLKAMSTKIEDRFPTVQDFQNAIRQYQSHSESIVLSSRAEEDLARAERTGDYQTFSRALFGFQEAFALWDGNAKAKAGVTSAKLAYAKQATAKEDYDLGASLLDDSDPAHAELHKKIQAAQRERDTRQQRLKNVRRIAAGLVAAMLIVVAVAFFQVRADRDKAVVATGVAEQQMNNAKVAEGRARSAESIAKTDRDKAVEEEGKANIARANALEQQRLAEEAKQKAEAAKREAQTQQHLAEQAKEAEVYESYVARIGLAAAKIDENAFDTAEQLLNDCPPKLRNWEWGRLRFLSTQSVRTFAPDAKAPAIKPVAFVKQENGAKPDIQHGDKGAPVEAVAFSHDGSQFVSGSWDGKARVWDVATGKMQIEIPYGGLYVHAVAFSPDGQWIATGGNDKTGYVRLWNAKTGALVRTFKGHSDDVLSVVFSKNGDRLLTSSYDKTARLWNVETGDEIRRYLGHNWWVWSAAFSPDETRIVTTSQDGTAIVWNTATGEQGPPFSGHVGPVYAAAFSPDGQSVVSGGYDNRLLIWKPADVKPFDYVSVASGGVSPPPAFRSLEGHTAPIRTVAFSPNGKMVLSAGHDNSIKLWDISNGHLIKSLRGHAGWVRSAAFSPDGHWVLSGSHDSQAKLWNISGYEEIRVFQGRILQGHADAVLSAAFSSDGARIVTASRDRTAKSWNVATGKSLRDFDEGHDYLASTAIFFPDGKRLLTAAADNTARIWDVTTGTQAFRLDRTGRGSVASVSHDGKWVVTSSDEKTARVWNSETGELARSTKPLNSEVSAVAFSADDQTFVTGDTSGECMLWNAKTCEEVKNLKTHTGKITAIAFAPGDKRVLTASTDHTVGQWDLTTGEEPTELVLKPGDSIAALAVIPGTRQALLLGDAHKVELWDLDRAQPIKTLDERGKPSQLAVSTDGRFALWADNEARTVRVWNLRDGREVHAPADKEGKAPFLTLQNGQVWSAAFSPDNGNLVTVGGNGARIWDLTTGAERMALTPHGVVASANFSKDGKRIVTGSWDNSAKIWNAQSGVAELKLLGHAGYVNSACFSPDGAYVLTASDDRTAKLWDAKSGVCVRTFAGHQDRVAAAVFSSDGKLILTGSGDKTARIWDAQTAALRHTFTHQFGARLWAVQSVAFSETGDRVITGCADNTARIWDVKSEQLLLTLAGHTASVVSVALSPDGKRALTGSQDNTAKLWDAQTRKEILTLKAHAQEVTSVAFSPDGRSVLTASRDGTAILWLTSNWREENAAAANHTAMNP